MLIASPNRRHVFLTTSVLVVGLSGSLAACSGDEEPSEASSSGASASGGTGETGKGGDDASSEEDEASNLPQVRSCTVVVDVSGEAEASWKGKGDVRVRTDNETGPTARYTASKGDALVIVYSPDGAIDYPAVTFSQGQQAFTSVEDDALDIDVEGDGTGAEAQVELSGFDEATVDADVVFTCAAEASKGSGKDKAKGASKNKARGRAESKG